MKQNQEKTFVKNDLEASTHRDENIGLADVKYVKPELSGKTLSFEIPKYDELYAPTLRTHPFYEYHDKNFDKERLMFSTLPLHVGEFKINYEANDITNVLRCPIKNAGSRKIIIPKELEMFTDFIKYCCIYETSFNNRFEDLYAHMTVDLKKVEAGTTQRVKGFHVDGFQGAKFPTKHEIEHSYLWASTCGTEFCVQPFFINHIDESKYLIFDELCKQAKEDNIYKCLDSNVYIFDPYMVHRSPVLSENTERLLVRITFEYQKLLDPNDTQNPKMKFNIPYKYDIRNRLCEFKVPLNTEMYGFVDKLKSNIVQ